MVLADSISVRKKLNVDEKQIIINFVSVVVFLFLFIRHFILCFRYVDVDNNYGVRYVKTLLFLSCALLLPFSHSTDSLSSPGLQCWPVRKALSLQVLAYCRQKYKANWGIPLSGYPFAMCHYRMKELLLVISSMLFFYLFIQKQAILYSGGSIVFPPGYSATHFVYNPSSIRSS